MCPVGVLSDDFATTAHDGGVLDELLLGAHLNFGQEDNRVFRRMRQDTIAKKRIGAFGVFLFCTWRMCCCPQMCCGTRHSLLYFLVYI